MAALNNNNNNVPMNAVDYKMDATNGNNTGLFGRMKLIYASSNTEKMVLLRQQNMRQQINFLLLQPKILLQQPNVLSIEVRI